VGPPPFGTCVWCERDHFAVEHIIGVQFAKALGIRYPVAQKWGFQPLPGKLAEISLENRVCLTCNQNWMRKLDNRVMQFLKPTIQHETPVELNLRKQETLAVWATKVALLLLLRQHDLTLAHPALNELVGASTYVPGDNFEAMRKSKRRPPEHTRVWMGAVSPGEWVPGFIYTSGTIVSHDVTRSSRIGTRVRHGYYTLFGLRRLIFYVTGYRADAPYATDPEASRRAELFVDRPKVRRLWPSTERVLRWPPPDHLSTEDLERLVSVPATWRRPPQGRGGLVAPP
jgi:hypothetical protein